jgi:hypothetical protein
MIGFAKSFIALMAKQANPLGLGKVGQVFPIFYR